MIFVSGPPGIGNLKWKFSGFSRFLQFFHVTQWDQRVFLWYKIDNSGTTYSRKLKFCTDILVIRSYQFNVSKFQKNIVELVNGSFPVTVYMWHKNKLVNDITRSFETSNFNVFHWLIYKNEFKIKFSDTLCLEVTVLEYFEATTIYAVSRLFFMLKLSKKWHLSDNLKFY